MKPTRRDYCQFILSSQINYTQTYFADHHPHFSHDAINRYLHDDNVTPEELWNSVKDIIEYDDDACLIFDDSVLDKNHAHKIDLVRLQYSGNAHRLIKGIGVVNCLYVNLRTGRYWVIDWRIYAPDEDHKTKLAHAKEMFDNAIHGKKLRFRTVLMDSWYATKELMKHIHASDKLFYCPLKSNRKVDDSGGEEPYKAVSELQWTSEQAAHGKLVKVHGFPGDFKLKLFRVAVENSRTEWIVTNDFSQNSTDGTREMCAVRWKIEQYHREVKQTLGIEKCQCRSARAQRNHIGCAMLVWVYLSELARALKKNIYSIKKEMLSSYMKQELKNPSVRMAHV
ncbi:IS701 family transposase [Azohydromonas australica]|uniref:IS701 family transposase n=1 Tax=Azohydromonas australica TaxID=364039 RepID=UPI000412D24B|nr:transposase [Azohydromonas australica]